MIGYLRDVVPAKAPETQKDNNNSIKQLRNGFDSVPIDAITPQHIALYRDKRTAKVRANREVTLFSHIFNMAREWGYTAKENPCAGVRKNKEVPRDFYADEEIWDAVYAVAVEELKDAMDIAYLTGQRPGDVRKMKVTDLKSDALMVKQGKTGKFLKIVLDENGVLNGLGTLLERLKARDRKVKSVYIVATPDGQPLTKGMMRLRFDDARAKAAAKAEEAENVELAARIRKFQFRDIRPKAASEIKSLEDASKLLGHTKTQITKTVYRRTGEVVKPAK